MAFMCGKFASLKRFGKLKYEEGGSWASAEMCVVPVEMRVVPLEMCVVPLEMCVVPLEMCVVSLEMCVVSLEMCVVPVGMRVVPVDFWKKRADHRRNTLIFREFVVWRGVVWLEEGNFRLGWPRNGVVGSGLDPALPG